MAEETAREYIDRIAQKMREVICRFPDPPAILFLVDNRGIEWVSPFPRGFDMDASRLWILDSLKIAGARRFIVAVTSQVRVVEPGEVSDEEFLRLQKEGLRPDDGKSVRSLVLNCEDEITGVTLGILPFLPNGDLGELRIETGPTAAGPFVGLLPRKTGGVN
jgi:hypothetical protein